jgi:hypothetical protein
LLLAILDKLASRYSLSKVDELFNQFSSIVRTDLDLTTSKKLAQLLGNPTEYKIRYVGLTEENVLVSTKSFDGQFILIPKDGEKVWNKVQSYIFEEISKN